MSEEELVFEAQELSRWQQHKFMALVGLAIMTALILASISLYLYKSSGAVQLDLSRPGYESVRQQAGHSSEFAGYSSSGTIDKDALDSFRSMYDEKHKEVTTGDSFGGDVMSDTALGIALPAEPQQ